MLRFFGNWQIFPNWEMLFSSYFPHIFQLFLGKNLGEIFGICNITICYRYVFGDFLRKRAIF